MKHLFDGSGKLTIGGSGKLGTGRSRKLSTSVLWLASDEREQDATVFGGGHVFHSCTGQEHKESAKGNIRRQDGHSRFQVVDQGTAEFYLGIPLQDTQNRFYEFLLLGTQEVEQVTLDTGWKLNSG